MSHKTLGKQFFMTELVPLKLTTNIKIRTFTRYISDWVT